jgi:predicted helicase
LDGRVLTPVRYADESLAAFLTTFLNYPAQPIQTAEELAKRMARLAHLICDIVLIEFKGKATDTLKDLYKAFVDVLLPDLSQEDFADMFAQTLAYGLFAARSNHTSSKPFRRENAAVEIPKTNPFLRRFFAAIVGPDLEDEPFRVFVDDLAQLLADSNMPAILRHFARDTGREDAVVHFYETFLTQYDPDLRELRGVYYTPESVVGYIIRSVNSILQSHFDCPAGLADSSKISYDRINARGHVVGAEVHRVLVLDPALGTGTFLYEVIDLIRNEMDKAGNAGKWPGYVAESLLPRLFGFELLMPPYAIARLKLSMQLAGLDLPVADQANWKYSFGPGDRLGVYLTNSLEEAITRSELAFGRYISEEANIASEIKRDLPIMVVVGNPPYSGHSANASWKTLAVPYTGKVSGTRKQSSGPKRLPTMRHARQQTFIGKLLSDYQRVDGAPLNEIQQKWLHDDYVKFIRFAQWRIEQNWRRGSGFRD